MLGANFFCVLFAIVGARRLPGLIWSKHNLDFQNNDIIRSAKIGQHMKFYCPSSYWSEDSDVFDVYMKSVNIVFREINPIPGGDIYEIGKSYYFMSSLPE
ncbi:unnamed protein product [Caenorhabditis angaria]|uniref:Ephrin RBD domain-containing protein n=1 Tax=Caenorhabditis angaria TaxID=860376 RepID=A0A9P1J1F0_9PELO|nr:unnamed protein product [Caenorhabditis angaria]